MHCNEVWEWGWCVMWCSSNQSSDQYATLRTPSLPSTVRRRHRLYRHGRDQNRTQTPELLVPGVPYSSTLNHYGEEARKQNMYEPTWNGVKWAICIDTEIYCNFMKWMNGLKVWWQRRRRWRRRQRWRQQQPKTATQSVPSRREVNTHTLTHTHKNLCIDDENEREKSAISTSVHRHCRRCLRRCRGTYEFVLNTVRCTSSQWALEK